jgi:hypothetical protein
MDEESGMYNCPKDQLNSAGESQAAEGGMKVRIDNEGRRAGSKE